MHISVGQFQEARGNCGDSCWLANAKDPARVAQWLLSPPTPSLDPATGEDNSGVATSDKDLAVRCMFRIASGACILPETPVTITRGEE